MGCENVAFSQPSHNESRWFTRLVFCFSTVRCVPVVTSRWVQQHHVQCALQAAAVHRPVTRPSHVTLGHTVVKDPSTALGVLLATSALPPVVSSI